MLTGAEVRLEAVLESDEPQLLESRDLALGERLVGEVDEGRPAPERQRLGQPRRGGRRSRAWPEAASPPAPAARTGRRRARRVARGRRTRRHVRRPGRGRRPCAASTRRPAARRGGHPAARRPRAPRSAGRRGRARRGGRAAPQAASPRASRRSPPAVRRRSRSRGDRGLRSAPLASVSAAVSHCRTGAAVWRSTASPARWTCADDRMTAGRLAQRRDLVSSAGNAAPAPRAFRRQPAVSGR